MSSANYPSLTCWGGDPTEGQNLAPIRTGSATTKTLADCMPDLTRQGRPSVVAHIPTRRNGEGHSAGWRCREVGRLTHRHVFFGVASRLHHDGTCKLRSCLTSAVGQEQQV